MEAQNASIRLAAKRAPSRDTQVTSLHMTNTAQNRHLQDYRFASSLDTNGYARDQRERSQCKAAIALHWHCGSGGRRPHAPGSINPAALSAAVLQRQSRPTQHTCDLGALLALIWTWYGLALQCCYSTVETTTGLRVCVVVKGSRMCGLHRAPFACGFSRVSKEVRTFVARD